MVNKSKWLFLHASYCILGLAIIISKWLLIFNIIKYLGAAYLIYLGIKDLLEKQSSAQILVEKSAKNITALQAILQRMFCNILNPKTIFFFLALFTMMTKPSMPLAIQIGYGA